MTPREEKRIPKLTDGRVTVAVSIWTIFIYREIVIVGSGLFFAAGCANIQTSLILEPGEDKE